MNSPKMMGPGIAPVAEHKAVSTRVTHLKELKMLPKRRQIIICVPNAKARRLCGTLLLTDIKNCKSILIFILPNGYTSVLRIGWAYCSGRRVRGKQKIG